MKITLNNYEPYFLDYLEGKLEENIMDDFMIFLKQNPGLCNELHLFENIVLPPEDKVFPFKPQLYKSAAVTDDESEMKVIAFLEGDVEQNEYENFKLNIENDEGLRKEYDIISKTRLIADPGIKLSGKRYLYRNSQVQRIINIIAGIAAALLILWGINFHFQRGNQKKQIIAENTYTEKQIELPRKVDGQGYLQVKKEPEQDSLVNYVANSRERQMNTDLMADVKPDVMVDSDSGKRNEIIPGKMEPEIVLLAIHPVENKLMVFRSGSAVAGNDQMTKTTTGRYLANLARKADNGGLSPVNRILCKGLDAAAELSDHRFNYKLKNGKISSIGLETRSVAFSIPVQPH